MTSTEVISKSEEITTQADTSSPVETLLVSCSAELPPLLLIGCEVSLGADSIWAITSILPLVCAAKAVKEFIKSIEHTATNSKHIYLHIFFISDKTCEVNYKEPTD